MAKSPNRRPKRVMIFISYASEDTELASSVGEELLQMFSLAPVDVFRDVGILGGDDYRTAIDNALDNTDILLVLLTDRLKPTYSYPGYEVGFFKKSIKDRPKIFGDLDRVIIPVCIGSDNPDTMHYIQSIKIPSDQIVKIPDATGTEENVADRAVTNEQDPVSILLKRISDVVMSVVGMSIPKQNLDAFFRDKVPTSAARLYRTISAYLQRRVSSETFPERKIIIRTDAPPEIRPDGADLSNATVELLGNSFQVFGFPDEKHREFAWTDFKKKMPSELGSTWTEGIRSLITSVLLGDADNYHVVSSTKGDKAFRLFVSRIITYVSKKTEIHIYIVQMIVRHYGDPLTTRLLSAISIGLRYRFLLLEPESKFNSDKLAYPLTMNPSAELDALKSITRELLSEMELVLRDANEANLLDPSLLELIWGAGSGDQVRRMMGDWETARSRLYLAAQNVLGASGADSTERKRLFLDALCGLKSETERMNREYTLRALHALSGQIEKSLGERAPTKAFSPGQPQLDSA
jgi:hypothetical protein